MGILLGVPLLVADLDPRFYLLDQASMLLVVPLVAVVVSVSANILYRSEVPEDKQPEEYRNSRQDVPANPADVEAGGNKSGSIKPHTNSSSNNTNNDDDNNNNNNNNNSSNDMKKKRKKKKKKSRIKKAPSVWLTIRVAFLAVAPMLFNSFLLIGYPLVVLPIYRSDSLSDLDRVIIVCFVHWLFVELTMHSMRLSRGEGKFDRITDKSREHYILSYLNIVMTNETCFLFLRRAMISMIRDPTTATIAIAFTGVEEMVSQDSCLANRLARVLRRLTSFDRTLAFPRSSRARQW